MRFFAILFTLAGSLLLSVSAFAQTPGQDALRAFDALRAGDWELANVYATRALEAGTLAPGDQAAVYGYRGDARRHLGAGRTGSEGELEVGSEPAVDHGLQLRRATRAIERGAVGQRERALLLRALDDLLKGGGDGLGGGGGGEEEGEGGSQANIRVHGTLCAWFDARTMRAFRVIFKPRRSTATPSPIRRPSA